MPRQKRNRERIFWPGGYGWHRHGFPCAPWSPPGWVERPTAEEEADALREHIEMLKEEMAAAENRLKELGEKCHQGSEMR